MPRLLSPEEVEHGTTAGSAWHKAHKVPLCDPCRVARNDYEKRRRGKPTMISKTKALQQLTFTSVVLKRLSKLHQRDYQIIVEQELEKLNQ